MSTIELHERLTLDSPPDRVWDFLIDPYKTVACLPGSELTGQEDERTFTGAVKMKVGAVRVSYGGTVVFEEVDEERRYVRIVGTGRETTGSGSAQMTMESSVSPAEGGATEVTIDAQVRVTGKLVRFGRGMIDTVFAQVLQDFRTRLAEQLSADEAPAPGRVETPAGRAAVDAATGGRAIGEPRPERDDGISLVGLLIRALRSRLARIFGRR